MKRIVRIASAAVLTLGLAVVGLPLGGGGATPMIGSTGCCKV